jgi:hypothetical protein
VARNVAAPRKRRRRSAFGDYLRLDTQTGIFFAVQLPQKAFINRVFSSKIVVECDMQTCCPQSEHEVTA